jgi:hypothetical protein
VSCLISGKIRELLGKPELPAERRNDQHDLDEQAWLVTRRPKEIKSSAEWRANVGTSLRQKGFEMFYRARGANKAACGDGVS